MELGGPDYALARAAVTDSEGREVLGGATGKGSGYRCARPALAHRFCWAHQVAVPR